MRPSNVLASATLLAGTVMADWSDGSATASTTSDWAYTTITPCPSCPSSMRPSPITVTEQFQPVSTCSLSTSCAEDKCKTVCPYTRYNWVSTVIPCAYDGTTSKTTTVTDTDQVVTVSHWTTVMTSWVPITKTYVASDPSWTSTSVSTSSSPVYTTIAKDYMLKYSEWGPWAFPGYEGSGLCKNCTAQSDGSSYQEVDIVECAYGPQGPQCFKFAETWVSSPAPSTTSTTAAVCSSHYSAPSCTGVHTFTFPFTAPGAMITGSGKTWAVPAMPWNHYVTSTCSAPGPVDWTISTTVTKTITWNAPPSTSKGGWTYSAPAPTGPNDPAFTGGWGDWNHEVGDQGPPPTVTPIYTAPNGGNPFDPPTTPGGGWGDWNSEVGDQTPSTAWPTTGAPVPTGEAIYITVVESNVRYYKAGSQYISFSGSDALVVDSLSSATPFYFVDGGLMANGDWIGADSTSGYATFEEFSSPPTYYKGWTLGGDGTVSWSDPSFKSGWGSALFCIASDNTIFIEFNAAPAFSCKQVSLYKNGAWTATSTSSYPSSTSWTTSATPDPSSDPDEETSSWTSSATLSAWKHKRTAVAQHGHRAGRL